jgi:hypothetical protein
MTTSQPNHAKNHIRDPDPSQIADVLKGASSTSCLLPRNCRKTLVVSVGEFIPPVRFQPIIEKTLQEQMPETHIWILSIEQDTDSLEETTKFVYSIVFICVQKELTEKLRAGGITKVQFYVGLSENEHEFTILDGVPLSSQVASHNRDGEPLPYNLYVTI